MNGDRYCDPVARRSGTTGSRVLFFLFFPMLPTQSIKFMMIREDVD